MSAGRIRFTKTLYDRLAFSRAFSRNEIADIAHLSAYVPQHEG